MSNNSWRKEHKRLHWIVTVRWNTPDLDGVSGEPESVRYKFPGSWSESEVLEAASMRWDESIDWLPSEHARACRTYHAVAKLIRACDVPYLH